jgi:hypothetical protein
MARVFLLEHVYPYLPGQTVEVDEARAADLVARKAAEYAPGETPKPPTDLEKFCEENGLVCISKQEYDELKEAIDVSAKTIVDLETKITEYADTRQSEVEAARVGSDEAAAKAETAIKELQGTIDSLNEANGALHLRIDDLEAQLSVKPEPSDTEAEANETTKEAEATDRPTGSTEAKPAADKKPKEGKEA